MDPVAEKFGVALKARKYQGDTTLDASTAKVNRAKASVYTWDDDRLQSTVVVKRKITKAATTIQRFIRACISHWEYFNQYKAPLVEELKDIERRRQEELEEVKVFLKNGFDQAKVEIESEFSLPQGQFEMLKKTTNGLRGEIKQQEEEAVALEKQINEQKHETRQLEKAKHELEARETLSRLDIEIPALEAEKMEMEGVVEEFIAAITQLKAQHDEMVTGAELEKRHKARLMKCLTAIVQLLEKREAKTKVIQSVKLSIKYKGEPPPRPVSAPKPTIAHGHVAPKTAKPKTAAPASPLEAQEMRAVTPTEETDPRVPSIPTMPPSQEKEKRRTTRKTSTKFLQPSSSSGSSTTSSSSDSDPASSGPKGKDCKSKRDNNLWVSSRTNVMLHSSKKSTKSSKSKSSRGKKLTSIDDSEAVFNWGDEAKRRVNCLLVGEASRRYARSLSPSKKRKTRKGGGSSSQSKGSVERSRSDDLVALAEVVGKKGRKLPRDAFDWAAMADDGVATEKRSKKDKVIKKKKDKDHTNSSRKSGKTDRVSITGTEGVFKFAYDR